MSIYIKHMLTYVQNIFGRILKKHNSGCSQCLRDGAVRKTYFTFCTPLLYVEFCTICRIAASSCSPPTPRRNTCMLVITSRDEVYFPLNLGWPREMLWWTCPSGRSTLSL